MSGRVTGAREGAAFLLTFDNPERHNALSHAMAREALGLLEQIGEDREIRLLVLRGAGERAFMSGADIGEQENEETRTEFSRDARAMIAAIGNLPLPVVAVVRGYCLGAGLAVAAQADLRIASADAQFGVPAARLGIAYPYDEVARLTALVGAGAAADLLLTGRRADAAEAQGWGLVQSLHDPARLDGAAADLVAALAANAPLSQGAAKLAIRTAAAGEHHGQDRATVDRLVEECASSEDFAEGRAAFRERRPPQFRAR